MKKIVVAQYWTNNISYSKYTEGINKKYCEEKGYIYHIETNTEKIIQASEGRAITWYKPKFILEVLETHNPDYVLFLDADAVICDFSYKIEEFIDERYDVICTKDHGPSPLNAGVFLFKNSDLTKTLMNSWWDICDLLPGGPNNQPGYYANALWHDQTCFGMLINHSQRFKNAINVVENHILNSRELNNGHKNFIFHAFGYGMLPYRSLDYAYYKILNLTPPTTGTSLLEIVGHYSTDKHYEHDYFNLIYNKIFEDKKDSLRRFVEIGLDNGSSIELWRDYFTNAEIIVTDPSDENGILRNKERITFVKLDQSKSDDLQNFSETYADLDVILDDGTHKMLDQQLTFAKLFKSIKSGGLYIIEDLHTSIELYNPDKVWCGWGDSTKTDTLNMLQNYIETNKINSDYLTQDDIDYLNNHIESVEIYKRHPNWSITSIIRKK